MSLLFIMTEKSPEHGDVRDFRDYMYTFNLTLRLQVLSLIHVATPCTIQYMWLHQFHPFFQRITYLRTKHPVVQTVSFQSDMVANIEPMICC